ncbi:MAG TPA: FxLYD domain-containing protein [Thermoanaerobaculia bacterium]|nr:FxLYD domain-containing protein [Thermoanaerobaculia bacterium]
MRAFRCGVAILFAAAALAFAADVVVLKGGARIELKKPPVRQGTVVMLTRPDGTLLSVPASEIDWKATAAASAAARVSAAPAPVVTAPPETPAEAARSGRTGAKARVKLTDADVAHVEEVETASGDKEKKEGEPRSGAARLEIADYTQEKSETDLVVRGSLRNSGGVPASSAHMTVTALDDKGEKIASGEAVISSGSIGPGATASFSAKIPVGEKSASSLRFAPQWLAPAPQAPVPSPTPGPALPAGGRAASGQKPESRPTPYGQGTLFAAPAPPASTTPPPDGSGYLPGMASPENQPKPPQ